MWVDDDDDELGKEDDEGSEEQFRPIATTRVPLRPSSLMVVIKVDGWTGLQLSNESVFNDLVDEEAEDDEDDVDDVDEEELIK